MDLDDLVQFVPQIIHWVQNVFPRELQGIVLVLMAAIVFAVAFFWHYSHVSVPVKFAAKKFAARQSKIREKAREIGFAVDDVDRDVPQFGKDKLYSLSREQCARYKFVQSLRTTGQWELLCRPGEYSAAFSAIGWVVQGFPSQAHQRSISAVVATLGEPKEFFEIGVEGRELSFYWNETGGMEGLAKLQSLLTFFLKDG